jgi:O-antigen/teichoic acid export membrane protein
MLQNDPERFQRFYYRIALSVGLVSMPLSVFLAVYAYDITLVVLGDQWSGAAIYFRIFALGGFIRAAASIPGFVLVSRGYTGRLMKLTMANTLVMILLMCLGLRWGPEGVAVAEVMTIAVMLGPTMYFSFRDSPVTIGYFLSALMRPAISSLLMALVLILLRCAYPLESSIASLSLGVVVAGFAMVFQWVLLPGCRIELTGLASDLKAGLRRKRPADTTS